MKGNNIALLTLAYLLISGRKRGQRVDIYRIFEENFGVRLAQMQDNLIASRQVKAEIETIRSETANYSSQAAGYANDSQAHSEVSQYAAYISAIGSLAWYGVEFNTTHGASAMTRIGNLDLHKELPIQSKRRGCLLRDNGEVNYYLHPNYWGVMANSLPSVRDGSDGQVMVECPEVYIRFETEGSIRRVKVSEFPLPGFKRVPRYYRGAYEASLHRPSLKLGSVANYGVEWRGGNNTAAWDSDDRSLLGRPVSSISRNNFQQYARNRGAGWEMESYFLYTVEMWLCMIEYADRNTQLPFNGALSSGGYRQGGLGSGVTQLNSANWSSWNNQNPFIPTGYTDSVGNYSGVADFELPDGYGASATVFANRWRGIENPFGHIWKWTNGVNVLIQADGAGGKSMLYVAENPNVWSGSGVAGYELAGLAARASGWVVSAIFEPYGVAVPHSSVGGSSSTFWTDYWYTSLPSSGESLRGLLVGGSSYHGSFAGLGCSVSNHGPADAYANIGSRLCYMGA